MRETGAGAASAAEAEAAGWPEVAEDAVEELEEWLGAAIPAAAARAGSGQKKTPGPGTERIDSVSAIAETWRARKAECDSVGAGGAAGSAGRREAVRPEDEKVALETKELGRIAIVEHEGSSSAQNEQYVACIMYCIRLLAAAAHAL